jgi:isocitrate dehydrogenase
MDTGRVYQPLQLPQVDSRPDLVRPKVRKVIGADIFLEAAIDKNELGQALEKIVEQTQVRLKMISNRGTKVYPDMGSLIDCVDQWRCRFVMRDADAELANSELMQLVERIAAKYHWMHIEKLQEFDGKLGYSLAQGEN